MIQCIDAELIVKDYGIDIFSFLNSVFQNCREKRLMGFFCSLVYKGTVSTIFLLFVCFDSLCPTQQFSVMFGWVFLG